LDKEEFGESINFLLDQMDVGLAAINVITNFIPKDHRDTTRKTVENVMEAINLVRKKVEEFKKTLDKDFEYFRPYIEKEINFRKETIEHNVNERVLPYREQEEFREQVQTELKELLALAKRCGIKIA